MRKFEAEERRRREESEVEEKRRKEERKVEEMRWKEEKARKDSLSWIGNGWKLNA
jgi:hypothetical protein